MGNDSRISNSVVMNFLFIGSSKVLCALSTPNLSVRIATASFVMAATRRVLKRLDEGPYKIRRNKSTQARLH